MLFQTPPAAPAAADEREITRVPLFFYRRASAIKSALDEIVGQDALGGGSPSLRGMVVCATGDENVLILYGTRAQTLRARQLIASLDLPVPGVRIGMWGFQISSRDPRRMADTSRAVDRDIDDARSAVRELNQQLQACAAQYLTPEAGFRDLLTLAPPAGLGYEGAFSPDRTLSLSDILLRLVAADAPADAAFAQALTRGLGYDYTEAELPGHPDSFRWRYRGILAGAASPAPFSHLFTPRGLRRLPGPRGGQWLLDRRDDGVAWLSLYNAQARRSVLDFTLNYADLIERPGGFSPYRLQQASDVLNGRLQQAADALNRDVEDLILQPALDKIGRDLAAAPGVEYAQMGRVEVAALDGTPATVEGTAVHAFDSLPPLAPGDVLAAGAGGPAPPLVALLVAAGRNRTAWSDLRDGISLEVTPNVLRNAASAELDIHLAVGDPQAGTRAASVPALSYVSAHEVRDRVYLDALDIFGLSTFSSRATLGGGRAYAPLIGPAWHGVFGDVPVLGDLFTWKKGPKTVYSESVLFAGTLITPTAMELALLYPHGDAPAAPWTADLVGQLTEKVKAYK